MKEEAKSIARKSHIDNAPDIADKDREKIKKFKHFN